MSAFNQVLLLVKFGSYSRIVSDTFSFLFQSHPYVKDNKDCKSIVTDALQLLQHLDESEDNHDNSNPMSCPRVPNEIMFVVGGWSGGSPINTIEVYDPRADRWNICNYSDPSGEKLVFLFLFS